MICDKKAKLALKALKWAKNGVFDLIWHILRKFRATASFEVSEANCENRDAVGGAPRLRFCLWAIARSCFRAFLLRHRV